MSISRRLLLTLGVVAALVGCSGNKPLNVIEKFYAAVAQGDVDRATECLALENVSANEMIAIKGKVAIMVAQGQTQIDANNGVAKITVTQEKIAEDGLSANVQLLVTFKNDKTKNETFKLRKEKGEWKIRL